MTTHSLLLLPGDGIGPEVMAEVERLVAFFNKKGKVEFKTETALVGGASIDKHGVPLDRARRWPRREAADAIVFGAVGGPKWDKVAYDIRPEAGLLQAAQGARSVRQPAPRHLLRGAGRGLLAASASTSRASTSSSCAS